MVSGHPRCYRCRSAGAGHNVSGDVSEHPIVAEGVGAKSDQRLADRHIELGCDHARRLMDHVLKVSVRVELGRQSVGRGVGLEKKDGLAATSAMTRALVYWSSVRLPGWSL